MATLEDFDNLFETTLKPRLVDLDALRKKALSRILFSIPLFVLAVIGFGTPAFAPALNPAIHPAIPLAAAVLLLVAGIVVAAGASKHLKAYNARYKEEFVREIVTAINPEWTYESSNGIRKDEYRTSGLFPEHFDRYCSDDLVTGIIDKTDFRCAEVHSEKKIVTHDKNGRRQERWEDIFHGLFFHADFNKHFKGTTYVEPDFAERFLGGFGTALQRIGGKGELVKLEDIAFEKRFVVYSSDQIEARYILTPAIMEAILAIADAFQKPIRISFVQSRVYVAVDFRKKLFEPRLATTCVKLENARTVFKLFKTNEVIVRELNLNTRIWTKE
ncbi:MAG: DUF3137 domain-containing protein [Fibrobacter sp.]|nr:DUF3137 domain-containing protein [Fibrobacter sp.]